MPHKHRKQKRERNHAWLNLQIGQLIALGDRRSRAEIAADVIGTQNLKRAERELAEENAHRGAATGNGEVVVHIGHHYPHADLHEGEVLRRGIVEELIRGMKS